MFMNDNIAGSVRMFNVNQQIKFVDALDFDLKFWIGESNEKTAPAKEGNC